MPSISELNLIQNGGFNGSDNWTLTPVDPEVNSVRISQSNLLFNTANQTQFGDIAEQTIATVAGNQHFFSFKMFERGDVEGSHSLRVELVDSTGAVFETREFTVFGGEATQTFNFEFDAADAATTVRFTNFSSTTSISTDLRIDDVFVLDVSGDDDIVGATSSSNQLFGGDGDDTLTGGSKGDTFTGGAGADHFNGGGSESDTVSYAASSAGVIVNVGDGRKAFPDNGSLVGVGGDAEGDTYNGINNITGSMFDDVLKSNSRKATLRGLDGDDFLVGSSSNTENLFGGEGNDTLNGGGRGDRHFGEAGDDLMISSGADTHDGGEGFDTVTFENAKGSIIADLTDDANNSGQATGVVFIDVEAIIGSNRADDIRGNDQDNLLIGGEGDDTITGGGGDDTLEGGAGTDTVKIDGNQADFTVELTAELDVLLTSISTGETILARDFESFEFNDATVTQTELLGSIIGTNGDDFLEGTAEGDSISGFDGEDTLVGGEGDDTLNGGDDEDVLEGGLGADALVGGSGTDIASYANAASAVSLNLATGGTGGEAEGDTFQSIERVVGSDFNDVIVGDEGFINGLSGGAGDDTLDGGGGSINLLEGGLGADELIGGESLDLAYYFEASARVNLDLRTGGTAGEAAGDSFTSIEGVVGSSFDDFIVGDDEGNIIFGNSGADRLRGGGGNDTIEGGIGADDMRGGAGTDTAAYDFAEQRVNLNLSTGGTAGDAAGDSFASIENVRGTSFNDFIFGNNAANLIEGRSGDDRLRGSGGNDTLNGGDGDDELIGGAGADILSGGFNTDTASYAGARARVNLDMRSAGTAGDAAGDTFINIENVKGTSHNDFIIGDAQDNVLDGGAGNDRLRGDDGNDTIIGGLGEDDMRGGAGTDEVNYAGATERVNLNLNTGGSAGEAAGDTFSSIENVVGSGFDDFIFGTNAANVIEGGAGADRLRGSGGDDTLLGGDDNDNLVGGLGADVLDGGAGIDVVSYRTAEARVNLDMRAAGTAGEADGDTFIDIETVLGSAFGDFIFGNAADNLLDGGDGDDRLRGDEGNDTLNGGTGDDNFFGGTGADVFLFEDGDGDDLIKDFEDDIDVIRLLDYGFADADAALATAAQVGSDVVFTLGDGDILTVEDATLAQLANDLEVV